MPYLALRNQLTGETFSPGDYGPSGLILKFIYDGWILCKILFNCIWESPLLKNIKKT